MRVLVLNSGSSSIKYQMFDMNARLATQGGVAERIGDSGARLAHWDRSSAERNVELKDSTDLSDHRATFERIVSCLGLSADASSGQLDAIGHRVVHGGDRFRDPAVIDEQVIAQIEELATLAPLHNPANLRGIEVARDRWPQVPQVAVFDTAFHSTMPPRAFRYAVPRAWYDSHGVRRYGFHGTSHAYVAKAAARLLDRPLDELNLITLHLGNGASIAAIEKGKSIDTSMGLTPLEGLVMGTRSGDLDPGAIVHLGREGGMTLAHIESDLNKESGLRGLCGSGDMRDVLDAASRGSQEASLALEIYCYRIRKYIGAYSAVLDRVDALVFTAGVGESSSDIRARVCSGLSALGISIDDALNRRPSSEPRVIDDGTQAMRILVVPTNEELEIATQTIECVHNRAGSLRKP